MDQQEIFDQLIAKDTKEALAAFHVIEAASKESPLYTNNLSFFLPALTCEKACGRGRAFKFFMLNAKWDNEEIIEKHLLELLAILNDPNAPVVRQCLLYLPYLVAAKPALIPTIQAKLDSLILDDYKESMQELIKKDIAKVRLQFG
ncbi:MAG: hypothetical protein ACTIC2_05000 [Enterococcus devriesei]|uniref:hypothetical protein n=1 Tax=Enterococcus devriesei TaxID=319970 RepID=UPI003F8FD6D6